MGIFGAIIAAALNPFTSGIMALSGFCERSRIVVLITAFVVALIGSRVYAESNYSGLVSRPWIFDLQMFLALAIVCPAVGLAFWWIRRIAWPHRASTAHSDQSP